MNPSEPLTNTELLEIRARCERVSAAPWKSMIEGRDHTSGSTFIMTGPPDRRGPDIELSGATSDDQDFVAHAREDVPRLLVEVERLRTASTDLVFGFVGLMAEVQARFRTEAILAERNPALYDLSTSVIPSKCDPSDYADDGVTIHVALNAELRVPLDEDKKAIGTSLLIRHAEGHWIAESEIGWSGARIGWDPFDSQEIEADTLEELVQRIPAIVDWVCTRFREETAKLTSSQGAHGSS